ncbi:MAG: acetyl-CoA carboxylase biotin carboxyl carrier protein subunit [Actinomycetota bacterium]
MIEIRAEIAATVWTIDVEVGAAVAADDELMILESMKMEIPVEAPSAGTVRAIHVAPGDRIVEDQLLVTLDG